MPKIYPEERYKTLRLGISLGPSPSMWSSPATGSGPAPALRRLRPRPAPAPGNDPNDHHPRRGRECCSVL